MNDSPEPMPAAPQKFAFVDALRGWAALYVLVYHLALIPSPNLAVPEFGKLVILSGGSGVSLFFVVSAFTLCLSMRSRANDRRPLLGFGLRRVFRIVPLFYLWMALTMVRDGFYFHKIHPFKEVLLDMSFLFNFFPGKEETFVWAGWTLGVEMVFYATFPLVFRLFKGPLKSFAFFVATLAVSSAWSAIVTRWSIPADVLKPYLHFSFLHALPIFSFGIFTFYVFEALVHSRKPPRVLGLALIGCAAGLHALLITGNLPPILEGYHWQSLVYGCLLLGLSIHALPLLVNRLACFYGKISYSMYLNHPTLVFFMTPVYLHIYSLHLSTSLKYGCCFAITLIPLTAASCLTYRYVEQPGIRLGSRLNKWLQAKQPFAGIRTLEPVGRTSPLGDENA